MTQILHRGILKSSEETVPFHREMSFRDLVDDIHKDFDFRTIINGKQGPTGKWDGWPGYRMEIGDRGRGQVFCLLAHFRAWYYTGLTRNYCHHCPFYEKQTTLMDQGLTEVCGKGYWLMDAN